MTTNLDIIKTRPLIPDTFDDLSLDKSHNDGNKDIPIQSLIEYRQKKLSYQEIADLVGCTKQNVHERLQTIGYVQRDLENYKKNKADTFAFIQSKLVNSLDDKTIKDMYPYQRVVAIGILNDKERLERGLATERIDSFSVTASLDELSRRKAELLRNVMDIRASDIQPVVSDDDSSKP